MISSQRNFVDRIRNVSVNLFSSVLIGSTAILTAYVVPFIPQNPFFAALVGVSVAILGYKLPRLSALISAFLLSLSVLYQLAHSGFLTFLFMSDLSLVIILWLVCMLFGSLSVDRHDSLVAFSLGCIAFLELFTSFWYLAIPTILIPSVMSKRFRTGLATIMFLCLYLPFQISNYALNNLAELAENSISASARMSPEVFVPFNPPFDPSNRGVQTVLGFIKPFAEPLSKLTIDEFLGKIWLIPQALSGGSEGFFGTDLGSIGISTYDIYNKTVFVYLNNVGSIIFFVIAIGLSVSTAYVTPVILSRFKPIFRDPFKELLYGFLRSIIIITASVAVFTGLFSGLADTLGYVSPFTQSHIQYMVVGSAIILTALPSSAKMTLEYSDKKNRFLKSLKLYEDEILPLRAFLNRLKGIDSEIEVVSLEKSLETLSARIVSYSVRVSRLGLRNLREMGELIARVDELVKEAKFNIIKDTGDYIVYKIRFLRETVSWILEMEWLKEDDEMIMDLERFDDESSSREMDDIERLLTDVIRVANTLTHRLMTLHEETRATLQQIFEVESRLTIDIEQSIIKNIEVTLEEGKIWTALQIIREEIEGMEAVYSERIEILRSRLTQAIEGLKRDADEMVYSEIKLLLVHRFDNFISVYAAVTTMVGEKAGGVTSVIGLRKVLDNTREQVLSLIQMMHELIRDLRIDITQRSPLAFDNLTRISDIHGSPPKPYEEVKKLLTVEKKSGEETISDLEMVLRKDLLNLVETLRDYTVLNERVLNYYPAETVISSLLEEKKMLSTSDLPFSTEHSIWYMKLYATQNPQIVDLEDTEEGHLLRRREV